MAIIQMNFYASSLMSQVNVVVATPRDFNKKPTNGYKTLYLLHGITGGETDWLYRANIIDIAEENNLFIIMPNGDNGCYINNEALNKNYKDYIGHELLNYTREMFPISCKKEDTFICGLSMGGYGAMNNGLIFNDKFSKIGALSMAVIPEMIKNSEASFRSNEFFMATFGADKDTIRTTDKDIRFNVENNLDQIPDIYMACGKQDFVFETFNDFHIFLKDKNINHTCVIEDGVHDWKFWNKHIIEFIKFLNL